MRKVVEHHITSELSITTHSITAELSITTHSITAELSITTHSFHKESYSTHSTKVRTGKEEVEIGQRTGLSGILG